MNTLQEVLSCFHVLLISGLAALFVAIVIVTLVYFSEEFIVLLHILQQVFQLFDVKVSPSHHV